jgi:hypothetical protein
MMVVSSRICHFTEAGTAVPVGDRSGTLEEDGGYMDEVNVAVIAPILGPDLSFVSDVDSRVRAFDASFAAPGHRAGPGGPAAVGSARPGTAGKRSAPHAGRDD